VSIVQPDSGDTENRSQIMIVKIFHNPRCSKSRRALELLEARGIRPVVVDYLRDPPDVTTLGELVACLGLPARALLRDNEQEYIELGLDDPALDDAALLAAVAAHPRLLQRPIVVAGGRARIGRPPESVLEIL
jgi:arsenate reductase